MKNNKFNPKENYEKTKNQVGYISLEQANSQIYTDMGFKSGLEIHQQLATKQKLFCRCPVGIYQDDDDFDAEIVRHMRPTLSELGGYDGTALMEFKTKKNIIYRIKNETACTYEIDDTPPFPLNREALEFAIQIAMMLKTNIVGELHITRKQYLDGSIPTGFQRTAIVGIHGEIPISNKKIGISHFTLEEDSCREISDIRHTRIYKTDRLGIPLIEIITDPDMKTPQEVKEAAQYLRFLTRASGKVRVGSGAGREDTNVSISGGTRVEIKGVSHNNWLPKLTHIEAFRQKSLLHIKDILLSRVKKPAEWKLNHKIINFGVSDVQYKPIENAFRNDYQLVAINLPKFKGILSHFTQPGQVFADEIAGRLKVIACLEHPNMLHSEDLNPVFNDRTLEKRKKLLHSKNEDAQMVIWSPVEDLQTALETIEERCKMAFEGVCSETRKSLRNGTNIFERVLPGADRMYPDTDSAPIPIFAEYLAEIRKKVPQDLKLRLNQMKKWKAPEDTYIYILRNNLFFIIKKIIKETAYNPVFVITTFAHSLKHLEGKKIRSAEFKYELVSDLFNFIKNKGLAKRIIGKMLPIVYEYPKLDFNSVLKLADFKTSPKNKILAQIPELHKMFRKIRINKNPEAETDWIMGQLRKIALGNIDLQNLYQIVKSSVAETGKEKK
ncbi:MAG: Glu-tRNA(Gln) amidotransferase subunit GatE [Candidatus Cloacimonadota bacterium]|nr:Glu-tRNA(Gln) amidotransferase subunit GatE [Candidatus Cloacimonadota bacterium]